MDSPHIINSLFLHKLIQGGQMEIIQFLMDKGLITKEYKCPKCKDAMKLIKIKKSCDGYRWGCRKQTGDEHYIVRTVRVQSMFSNSRMKLSDTLLLMYYWVHKCTYEFIGHEMSVSVSTINEWMKYCREICLETLLRDQSLIGGEGVTVEIIYCKFGERSIEGGIEGDWLIAGAAMKSPDVFLAAVPEKSVKQIMKVIEDYILPETTVICEFLSEHGKGNSGFHKFLDKRSLKFKSAGWGVNTDITDPHWKQMKNTIKKAKKQNMFLTFAEYLWRRRAETCDFQLFLLDAKKIYPPPTEDPENSSDVDNAENDN